VETETMTHPTRTRGLDKPTLRTFSARPPRCAAMAVGSVPYSDPETAIALVMGSTPEIPTWPQLPRRTFHENMFVQFTEGFPGVRLDEERERIYVLDELPTDELLTFVEALEAGDPSRFAISPDYAAALPLLKQALTQCDPPFVKGQVTGPISQGLALPREDRRALLYDETLRDIAVNLIVMKARWQADLLSRWASGAVPLIMVDEPSLTQMGSAFVSIPEDIAFPALKQCLDALGCLTGLHVCGATDWGALSALPVDVLNFDAADHMQALLTHREAVATFLGEGGMLAWGVVPNDARSWEKTPEETGTAVLEGAEALAEAGGQSVEAVLEMSFVCPACGTGALTPVLAERCFALSSETSAWLRKRL